MYDSTMPVLRFFSDMVSASLPQKGQFFSQLLDVCSCSTLLFHILTAASMVGAGAVTAKQLCDQSWLSLLHSTVYVVVHLPFSTGSSRRTRVAAQPQNGHGLRIILALSSK